MKKPGLFLSFLLLLTTLSQAQNADPLLEFQRQMEKMMQDLRSGYSIQFPSETDTSFFFKWDTTLNNGHGDLYFRFGPPFGKGSDDPLGFNEMIKEFNDFAERLSNGRPTPKGAQPPADDGAHPDELLPEERLRQQEQNTTPKSGEAPAPAKVAPVKPKIKTTRI